MTSNSVKKLKYHITYLDEQNKNLSFESIGSKIIKEKEYYGIEVNTKKITTTDVY